MIDKNSEDMQLNRPHVIDMMRFAIWCLKFDFTNGPSMSTVIKVLGVMKVPDNLEYRLLYPIFTNDSARIGQEGVEFMDTISVVLSLLADPFFSYRCLLCDYIFFN